MRTQRLGGHAVALAVLDSSNERMTVPNMQHSNTPDEANIWAAHLVTRPVRCSRRFVSAVAPMVMLESSPVPAVSGD